MRRDSVTFAFLDGVRDRVGVIEWDTSRLFNGVASAPSGNEVRDSVNLPLKFRDSCRLTVDVSDKVERALNDDVSVLENVEDEDQDNDAESASVSVGCRGVLAQL